jgi:ankyrin repeat protein
MKSFYTLFFSVLIVFQYVAWADTKQNNILDERKLIQKGWESLETDYKLKPTKEDDSVDIDISGRTRVMRAMDSYDPKKVDEALNRSSNPYSERYKDRDLLDYALKNNSYTIVKLLMDRYADFPVTKERLFRYIDSYPNDNDPDIIELLLKKGNLSINVTDEEGKTLMHHALRDAQLFEIKYLLDKKIDINIKDHQGLNALDTAKSWLKIYEERNAKTPWNVTQKRIQRLNSTIPLLENASNSPSH